MYEYGEYIGIVLPYSLLEQVFVVKDCVPSFPSRDQYFFVQMRAGGSDLV